MTEQQRLEHQQDRETYARLTAPRHVTLDHFRGHQKVEGYFENRDLPDFMGCDRLLKIDHLYGTVQMGYDPRKGQPFLFANIKTSLYDTAASRYQREIKEYRMMRNSKAGNENLSYSANRRADTAVILYRAERKPWSELSLLPHLKRMDQGALRKTMPFLLRDAERERLEEGRERKKELEREIRGTTAAGGFAGLYALRREELELSKERETLQSLLTRKLQQSRLFFRRINMAYDIQKHEMFDYYREVRERRQLASAAPLDEPPKKPADDRGKEGNGYE
ncbi:hypothetical protein H8711_06360 [Clostridiaceae bacterium NSJ-31]|uniref:Uncharacterized protein n=1 Tax=Ligaoa zhengdingensis TaxID=2763658 RepID=A0A926DXD6_9FIRM|nr:hypothetical protein [Ligaoa zhengdingensis]MBC8546556.1 hypothetical protein [Ligaoa zhengdingensis]